MDTLTTYLEDILKVNAVDDTYNIRRIIPYHAAPNPGHGREGSILVRFEPTNLRIVYLKDYLRKMKYVHLKIGLDNKVQHQLFNTLTKPIG
jgi:hypothetical protein